MSEDLVKFEDKSDLPAELRQQFEEQSRENLEGVTPRLPKIALPTGQSKEFSIEKFGEEANQVKTFTGVILYQTAANAYWAEKFGTGANVPPDCASHDGIIPSTSYNNLQAKTCAECKWSKFGTATGSDGQKARGKACRNVKRIVVLVQGEAIPYLMTAPPGSIKSFEEFMINLRKDKRPYWSVASTFTISTETNATGIKYPQIHAAVAGYINNPDILKKISVMRDEWMGVVKQTQFSAAEIPADSAPSGAEYVPPAGGEEF
jgi:hypothetical protein